MPLDSCSSIIGQHHKLQGSALIGEFFCSPDAACLSRHSVSSQAAVFRCEYTIGTRLPRVEQTQQKSMQQILHLDKFFIQISNKAVHVFLVPECFTSYNTFYCPFLHSRLPALLSLTSISIKACLLAEGLHVFGLMLPIIYSLALWHLESASTLLSFRRPPETSRIF